MTESETGTGWTPVVVGSSEAATPATRADLIDSVTRIDRAIKERRETDQPLINWWLYFLFVSWITFGFYGLYLFFKRINRIDAFSARKRAYYRALLEWTRRQAAGHERAGEIEAELQDLETAVAFAYGHELRPIRAGRSFLLTLVTLGIYGYVVLYRENRYWWDAQVVEQDFDDRLSQLWTALGIIRYPITYAADRSKRRSFPLYLILSIVTLGIWGLVWDYKIHTDPDRLFGEFHAVEDSVLQTVRTH
ncbi:MAG TPA: DUF4234 domain-containing protein [Solirubrobacteraceae bacterium]|nr:DUF4234 domain-containing protein [Solirubrobacteraceae bacterium]